MLELKRPAADWINHIKNRVERLLVALFLIICLLFTLDLIAEKDRTWTPHYPPIELDGIVSQRELSERDYHTILMQTGLGKEAVDELREKNTGDDRTKVFERYQNSFFSKKQIACRQIAFIVREERLLGRDGTPIKGFPVASLKNGDVLVTKATHSLGWRHGHAAIVTDASTGETLEAIVLGDPSAFQDIEKWQTYPSFIQLRLKKDENKDSIKIAEYAKKTIYGVPYGLLTGIPEKAPY